MIAAKELTMSRQGNFYPPEGHDWVSSVELRNVADEAAEDLMSYYQAQVDVFRVVVNSQMESYISPMQPGIAWLFFRTHSKLNGKLKEVAILTHNPADAPEGQPSSIRLISNEIGHNQIGKYVISEDIYVFPDGDAQFFSDAAQYGLSKHVETAAVILEMGAKSIILRNCQAMTPIMTVTDDIDGEEKQVTPFGVVECFEDKCFAIERALEVVNQVALTPPSYKGSHIG